MLLQNDLRHPPLDMSDKLVLTNNKTPNRPIKKVRDDLVRETFVLPRKEARDQVKAWLESYPAATYWSRVETWKELDDGSIKFTMVRLPNAD